MQNWRQISIVVVALAGCLSSSAEIIPEALLSFPSQTSYVEYDNLQSLRTLKNYSVLRQRFTGKPLEEAKAALARLDIQEDQVHEIVSGTSPTAFYGLVSGIFSGQAAAAVGKRKGFAVKILESQAYCPGGQSCVVFLENSLAAFGTPAELKRMLEARQGFTTRLSSNRDVVSLLNNTEWQAPVRGAMFGGELNIAIAGLLKDWTGWNRDWSALAANMKALVTASGSTVRRTSALPSNAPRKPPLHY